MCTNPEAADLRFGSHDSGSPPDEVESGAVLVPIRNGEPPPLALELARTIAAGGDAELVVLNAVCPPERTSFGRSNRLREDHREATAEVVNAVEELDPRISVQGTVQIGRNFLEIVREAVETRGVGTVVVDQSWNRARLSPLTRTPLEKLNSTAGCRVVLPTGCPFPETVSSVLVPVAGGPHSKAVTEIARAIASRHDSWIELLHVVPSRDDAAVREATRYFEASKTRLEALENVDTWLLEADSIEEAIIEQTQYYDVTVIGGPRTPRLRRYLFDSTSETVQQRSTSCPVTVWGSSK